MHRRFFIYCFFFCILWVETSYADIDKVRKVYVEVERLEFEINESKGQLRSVQSLISDAQHQLEIERGNYLKKNKEYKEILSVDEKNPGLISEGKILIKRSERADAHAKIKKVESKLVDLHIQLSDISKEHRIIENRIGSAIDKLKYHSEKEIEKRLRAEKERYEVIQRVHVNYDYDCSDDETLKKCKSKTRLLAEREAIEKGAIVTISSITEMKDLQIESENISSEVNATIVNRDVIKNNTVNVKASGFVYEMYADIQPHLSAGALEKIRSAIALDVMGKYSALLTSTSSNDSKQVDSSSGYLLEIERKEKERIAEKEILRQKAEKLAADRKAKKIAEEQRQARIKRIEAERIKEKSKPPVMVF
jgi:hypothetical protein